jgi:hypothetical protein
MIHKTLVLPYLIAAAADLLPLQQRQIVETAFAKEIELHGYRF